MANKFPFESSSLSNFNINKFYGGKPKGLRVIIPILRTKFNSLQHVQVYTTFVHHFEQWKTDFVDLHQHNSFAHPHIQNSLYLQSDMFLILLLKAYIEDI